MIKTIEQFFDAVKKIVDDSTLENKFIDVSCNISSYGVTFKDYKVWVSGLIESFNNKTPELAIKSLEDRLSGINTEIDMEISSEEPIIATLVDGTQVQLIHLEDRTVVIDLGKVEDLPF